MLPKRWTIVTIYLNPQQNDANVITFEARQQKGFARIDFEVKKYASTSQSGLATSTIEIYNLKDEDIEQIAQRGLTISLDAGYEEEYEWGGRISNIFTGKISSVIRSKKSPDSPDVITTILCVTGLPQQNERVFSETIRNMSLKSCLSRICSHFGLVASFQQGTISAFQGNVENEMFNGDFTGTMNYLSSQYDFNYAMEGNAIIFSKRTGGEPIVTITPTSGLIGLPEVTEKGVDLKVFLNPRLTGGIVFKLDSQLSTFKLGALEFLDRVRGGEVHTFNRQINNNRYQGYYYLMSLIHRGSSHTSTWETEIESMNAREDQVQKRNK